MPFLPSRESGTGRGSTRRAWLDDRQARREGVEQTQQLTHHLALARHRDQPGLRRGRERGLARREISSCVARASVGVTSALSAWASANAGPAR